MAIQKGILKIEGTVGGLTFYKSKGTHLVKEKGGVSGERIAKDPRFVRTRENNAEFGAAGSASKFMRDSLRAIMATASDNQITPRLTTLMHSVMKQDTTSSRGKRTPGVGLLSTQGKALIKGFNFNSGSQLGSVLFKPYSVDMSTGVITINSLSALTDVAVPTGATDITISGAIGNVDLVNNVAEVQLTNVVNFTTTAPTADVVLTPIAFPIGKGTVIYLLKIEFFQSVNGTQYPLKNGAYNALAIVEVE